ncbi:pcp, partial [Mucuna pruriens]
MVGVILNGTVHPRQHLLTQKLSFNERSQRVRHAVVSFQKPSNDALPLLHLILLTQQIHRSILVNDLFKSTELIVVDLCRGKHTSRIQNEEMGSEGPKKTITIHITGFKKFQGVPENPSEAIVNNLKDYVEKRGLPAGVTLGSCTMLDVAGVGALAQLYQTLESAVSKTDTASNANVVWLHLGVNTGAVRFAIEQQAANEATFRCPDELGWQPQQEPIVREDGGISRTRKTSLPVDAILKTLKGAYDVMVSSDAGRFVCNYVYYQSLRFAEQKGNKSLFVHVPLFSRINEETQMQFTASLLEAIASAC